MASNKGHRGNTLLLRALEELGRRLPVGWSVRQARSVRARCDAALEIRGPDRRAGIVLVEAKARLAPRDVDVLAAARVATNGESRIVVSPYLSARTQERLRAVEIGYLDLTGNARVVLPEPALFIETSGAAEAPDRSLRPARSLSGPKAGRIVRALADRKVAPGVRELAGITGVDAGYVSRVLAFLDSEALVRRSGRGRIEAVDWEGLLRRWAREAPLDARGEVRAYIEPRGLTAFLDRLVRVREPYAVTGALAGIRFAPVAPPRLAIVWMRQEEATAKALGLHPADSGANVLLVTPADDLVFEGVRQDEGIRYVAPSQAAVDLLTSPGRGPAEAEALLEWMRENEGIWRG